MDVNIIIENYKSKMNMDYISGSGDAPKPSALGRNLPVQTVSNTQQPRGSVASSYGHPHTSANGQPNTIREGGNRNQA